MKKHNYYTLIPVIILLWTACLSTYAQDFQETFKATASDREANDVFGYSTDIFGNYAIAGAPNEDENASGSDSLADAGAAYIFHRDEAGNWQQVQKLTASDREADDYFGYSVAIYDDYAFVGAALEDENANGADSLQDAGAVYIFVRASTGNWLQVQKITASDRESSAVFGNSVSVSENYAIIGASSENKNAFGNDSLDNAGAAYMLERNASTGQWSEIQKLTASDREAADLFGYSVSISGNYAIIGTNAEDENVFGNDSLNNAGAAYIFKRNSVGKWKEQRKLTASDREAGDLFGLSVSIHGDYSIVGAPVEEEDTSDANTFTLAGSAYIYKLDEACNWHEMQKIVASDRDSNSYFGFSTDIYGNHAIVGSPIKGVSGVDSMKGAAYIFRMENSSNWVEQQKLTAFNRDSVDLFGISVSLTEHYAMAGAYYEDEDTNNTNTLEKAGSAYIFEREDTTVTSAPPQTFNSKDTTGKLKAYPNPTTGQVTLVTGKTHQTLNVRLLSLTGELVDTFTFRDASQCKIDIRQPRGMYFVEVTGDNEWSERLKVLKE